MLIRLIIYFSAACIFSSCSSLSINKAVEVNENEDWLMSGGNPEKTNVSMSPENLNPPFNLQWQYDVDAGLSKSCLSASDAILFASTLKGDSYSFDISTGKSLGRFSSTGRASFSTPVVYDNNLIITSSGDNSSRIFSYNLLKGEAQWQRNVSWVESSPVLAGENIYVSNTSGELYKLNVKSGNIIWKSKEGKYLKSFYNSPTVSKNVIYIGDNTGYMNAYESEHCRLLWSYKTAASIYCDASVSEGRVYFGSDDKCFYSIDTLGNLKWKKDLGTKFLSSPSFFKGSVIISAVDGNVYSLDRENGNIIWTFHTKGVISASPLLHKDKIFIGSYDKFFYCINASDGKELWKYKCEGRIHTGAVIWKNYIFTASDEKYIYCFK